MNSGNVRSHDEASRLGIYDPELGDLQVFFSNYSATSLLESTKFTHDLAVENFKVNVSTIGEIVQSFAKAYKKSKTTFVSIDVAKKKFEPKVVLNETGCFVIVQIDFAIKNPMNTEQNAAVINLETTFHLSFEVLENLRVKFKIEKLSSKTLGFESYIYTGSHAITIQNQIERVNKILLKCFRQKIEEIDSILIPQFTYASGKLHQGTFKIYRHHIGFGVKANHAAIK